MPTIRILTLLITILTLSASCLAAERVVNYVVDAREPASGMLQVEMTFGDLGGGPLRLLMPAWTPGAYFKADYGNRVENLRALDQIGGELEVSHPDTNQWEIDVGGATAVSIIYDLKLRNAGATHVAIADAGVFLGDVAGRDRPADVEFLVPEGWRVATAMTPGDESGTRFHVDDYDELVDCPVEMGQFDLHLLEVEGTTVEVVVHGSGDLGDSIERRLLPDIRAIVAAEIELFGDAPFDRYVFLFHLRAGGGGGGGLEHMDSTTIQLSRQAIDPGKSGASVIAHELFHAWNVKRLRSAPIRPYDYSRLPEMDSLWFHEGVTSYYATLVLRRAGITSDEEMLSEIAGTLANCDHTQNYYTRGAAYGFLLDCMIRAATGNTRSLDDAFRYLDWAYAKHELPFQESAELGRVFSGVAGRDLLSYVNAHCVEKQPIDAAGVAALAGFSYLESPSVRTPFLGVNAGPRAEGGVRIDRIVRGASAERAGLRVADIIRRWGDVEIGPDDWPGILRRSTPGAHIPLVVEREGERIEIDLELGFRESFRGRLQVDEASPRVAIARALIAGVTAGDEPLIFEAAPAPAPGDDDDDWF